MRKGSGHQPVNLVCQFCGIKFQRPYKLRDQKYCSLKCTSLSGWAKNRVAFTKPCDICGKPMETRPDRVASGRGKFCSKVCYSESMKAGNYPHKLSDDTRIKLSKQRIGKLNPGYVHGKSYTLTHYKSGFTRLLREKAMVRDGKQCQECFTDKMLVVHHIDKNQLNSVLENLVVLCRPCHKIVHPK